MKEQEPSQVQLRSSGPDVNKVSHTVFPHKLVEKLMTIANKNISVCEQRRSLISWYPEILSGYGNSKSLLKYFSPTAELQPHRERREVKVTLDKTIGLVP